MRLLASSPGDRSLQLSLTLWIRLEAAALTLGMTAEEMLDMILEDALPDPDEDERGVHPGDVREEYGDEVQ